MEEGLQEAGTELSTISAFFHFSPTCQADATETPILQVEGLWL